MPRSMFDALWDGENGQGDPTKPAVPKSKSSTAAFDSLWDAPPVKPQQPTSYFHAAPSGAQEEDEPEPSTLAKAGHVFVQPFIHPIDTAKGIASSTADTFKTAGGYLGQRAAELTLPADVRKLAEADPTRISGQDAALAGAQIGAMLVAPGVTSAAARGLTAVGLPAALGSAAATAGTGAGVGALMSPDDPGVGALAGAGLGIATHGVGHALKGAGGVVVDAAGRPMENTPLKVAGVRVGTIEGIRPRATRLNAEALQSVPADGLSPFSEKPVAPMDVSGTAGVRTVRGLKTASPAAESIVKDALRQRADDAVARVIQHGLETTGLASRENGLQVLDDMIAQRSEHGNQAYQPVFAKYNTPIADPTFAEIGKTPAGQQALKRAGIIAANRGEQIGTNSAVDVASLPADKQALFARLVQMNGGKIPPALAAMRALGETMGETQSIAPTLRQAHFVKLAFDDMLKSAPEPGTGGLGPNNAASIRLLQKRWVNAMDKAAPEYGAARKLYADESDLVRGAEFGQNLFKMDPALAEKTMRELPQSAQDVARRTGFDALADRIENGPADVERGLAKIRDQRRMRLLFPTEESFNAFKQGLAEEAQLHANEQGALGGSVTADKLADVANMAGITLPDVMRSAASGRWHQLAGRAAANLTRKVMGPNMDRMNVERARQLVAGANGDLDARNAALEALGVISPQRPPMTGRAWTPGPVQQNPDLLNAGSTTGPTMFPGGVPSSRRIPFTTPTVGDVQQGAAVPIRQPVPLERRLPSAGPTPTPTAGPDLFGPSIPMGGQTLAEQVKATLDQLYRKNPEWAVSLSGDAQRQLEARVREILSGTSQAER